ncbi:MAG: lytic transglycosylase domain-containing protein [Pseudomonadota bacterium]
MPIQLIPISTILALLLTAQAGFALPDRHLTGLCDQAARAASRTEGVPLDVLRAIARVETGRTQDGTLHPWPWTVNVEGQGYWFTSEQEAKSYVLQIFKAGKRSFDVGCFQINYRWHGKAFRSIDAMFDPDENAAYAARFLKDLYTELGSWPDAAGAYHSRTQALADRYRNRFRTVLAQLDHGIVPLADPMTHDPFTTAATPLIPLQAHSLQPGVLGSLVPASGTATAFIAFH